MTGDIILVIDGPGFLTPGAAAVAAARRYNAELLHTLEYATVDDAGPDRDEVVAAEAPGPGAEDDADSAPESAE